MNEETKKEAKNAELKPEDLDKVVGGSGITIFLNGTMTTVKCPACESEGVNPISEDATGCIILCQCEDCGKEFTITLPSN
ncbi:MAG: hypothetical protein IJ747_07485 [Lachnospiraceae bacterium]|nr:hypothetical protein [Lachnospiraceae bacterium]MBR1853226.1 hypothetical protein [Lachnospiraceae bacterium]